jgi:DNA-binding MarR family transcriptional regulator
MTEDLTQSKEWTAPSSDLTPIFVRSELDDYGLDVYEFRVLAHVARRDGKGKNGNGRGCFSKQKKIAEACGVSHRKVHEALRVLCAAGFLTKDTQEGSTNIYRLAPASNWKHPRELDAIRRPGRSAADPIVSKNGEEPRQFLSSEAEALTSRALVGQL